MARGRKPKAPKVEKTIQFKASEFRETVQFIGTAKTKAAGFSGDAGAKKKAFCEKNGISREAMDFALKIAKMDSLKGQNVVDEAVMLCDMLGVNDQSSLFERVSKRKERDVAPEKPSEEEKDLRPGFLKNAMPLDEAEKKLTEANDEAEAKKSSRTAPATSPLAAPVH